MIEREQFIRAICEEPWRDDVRLVYSDWLEEQGEVEQAEFIRTQIERVAVPQGQFHHREQELLTAHNPKDATPNVSNYSAWFNPFWKTLKNAKWEYRRGFVHTVRCRLTDWFGEECANQRHVTGDDITEAGCPNCEGKGFNGNHGPAIAACQPVERIEFADKEPSTYDGSRWSWFNTEVPGGGGDRIRLPERVLRLLEGFDNSGASPNMVKWYNSHNDAISALSNAATNWATREAGLPKQKFLQAGLALAGEGC